MNTLFLFQNMILIQIPDDAEPECLSKLRAIPESEYRKGLKDNCKDQVERTLLKYQNNLCAYCQKSIENVKTIEHYISISQDTSLQLVWNNFLAVCSGNWYLNGPTDFKIIYCHKKKGHATVHFNPKIKEHIDSLYYDNECRLCSNDHTFNTDINKVLNLNFDQIRTARSDAFIKLDKIYKRLSLERKLTQAQSLNKAIKTIKSLNPEYSGFLLYFYIKKLNKLG